MDSNPPPPRSLVAASVVGVVLREQLALADVVQRVPGGGAANGCARLALAQPGRRRRAAGDPFRAGHDGERGTGRASGWPAAPATHWSPTPVVGLSAFSSPACP